MSGPGGAKHHRERLGEAIRDEIGALVEGELGDPRIGLASVTRVELSPDGRSARVFVLVEGDEQDAKRTLQGLDAAKNFVRQQLLERLRLRRPLEIIFQLDCSRQYEVRVEQLLGRIRAKPKP